MDVNLIFSLTIIISGAFSFLCYFRKPGKFLFPNLHVEGASAAQRYSILLTGIFGVFLGLYSLIINPLFG